MDIFERLKRATGNIPWETFASVMAQNLGANGVAAQEIVEQLKEWGSHLTKNALSKWTSSVMVPTPCDSPDVSSGRPMACPSFAVVKCDVCGRPCCLAHARVDYMGDAICEVCIGEAKARRRASSWADGGPTPYARPHAGEPRAERRRRAEPPPHEPPTAPGVMSRADALRVLKLPKNATWMQVKTQYRKLVLKHNADRPQSDAEREKNTERLKKINAAYAVLKAQYEKREAA
jgi:hypothetical protein